MDKVKHHYSATIIKIVCVFLFLVADTGCAYERQTITGKVVDESGAALSGVAVSACYSGWGRSSGYVVWDKNFCSEIILTNNDGSYVINFEGPGDMRLMARKDGWIQTQDFNISDSSIFLTRAEEYSARQADDARIREEDFRQRLTDESNAEYYCRVILSRTRSVTLDYQGESLSIVPILIKYDDHSDALFAVSGSSMAASSFANEFVIRVNGQTVNGSFSVRSAMTTCRSDIHFIEARIPGLQLGKDERIEILIPGIHALLDMQIWNYSIKP